MRYDFGEARRASAVTGSDGGCGGAGGVTAAPNPAAAIDGRSASRRFMGGGTGLFLRGGGGGIMEASSEGSIRCPERGSMRGLLPGSNGADAMCRKAGRIFFSLALLSTAGPLAARAADPPAIDRKEDVVYGRKFGTALTL